MSNRAERRAAARAPARGADRRGGGRIALLPAVLAASAVLAGFGLASSGGYVVIRFVVAILTLVVCVFAFQDRGRWWLPPLAAIVVVWNPIVPIALAGPVWTAVQVAAVVVLLGAGATIRRRG